MVRNQTKQNIYSRPGTDVCTHLVLAVHQRLVGLVLHVLGEPGHSSQYKHYITRAYIWNPLERTMLYSRHARPAHFSSRN